MKQLINCSLKRLLPLVCMLVARQSQAQDVIYISEEGIYQLLRVNFAVTSMSMKLKDSAGYTAYGIHLSNEVKIISAFWDVDKKFTVHDGFYFDMSFGRGPAHADKTIASGYNAPRGRGALTTNMGYFCLAGYRTQPWGALGGIDFRWRHTTVAKVAQPNLDGPLFYGSFPLVVRLEKGLDVENPNKRLALMLWTTLSDKKRAGYQSAKVEYGISDNGRWNLFAQWQHQAATGEDLYRFTDGQPAVFNQMTFGLRVGNLP
jgi:hypothetical protein